MAYSNIKIPADGSTSTFSVPFLYLNKNHVHVFIDGVETFDFTWVTEATISLNTTPPAGSIVTIQRITPKDSRNVDFQNGSALNPDNLDLDSNQLLYIMQENSDKADESLRIDTDNKWDAQGRVIKNVGDPVDDEDFLNKGVADQFLASVRASETNAGISEDNAKVSEDNAYIYSKIAQNNALIIASSQLAQAIGTEDTSLTVLDGSSFPDAPFVVSIEDEIIEVGAKDGNTFSALVRGLEGTTPASHVSGVRVENRFTAGTYQQLVNDLLAHTEDLLNPHNVAADQIEYTSGVTGFTPVHVKTALDALAGVRIVEMGSNENGEYVKWDNGLMVCFGITGIVPPSGSFVISFPAIFVKDNTLILAQSVGNGLAMTVPGFDGGDAKATSATLYNTNSANASVFFWLVVGRWK